MYIKMSERLDWNISLQICIFGLKSQEYAQKRFRTLI